MMNRCQTFIIPEKTICIATQPFVSVGKVQTRIILYRARMALPLPDMYAMNSGVLPSLQSGLQMQHEIQSDCIHLSLAFMSALKVNNKNINSGLFCLQIQLA